MRVLVTGTSGFIGRALVADLAGRSFDVRPILREASDPPPGLRPVATEGLEPAAQGLPKADVLVHLAAANPVRGDALWQDEAALRRANVDHALGLARAAAEAGVRRFVFASSAAVYPPSGSLPFDEAHPPAPTTAYGRSKLEAEAALGALARDLGLGLTILRLAPVYGIGARSGMMALARLAARPMPLPFGRARAPRSYLSLRNAVHGVVTAVTYAGAAGGIYNLADPQPLSTAELLTLMRSGLGRAPALVPVPATLLRGAALASGRRADWERLFAPFVIDTQRARDELEWIPPETPQEAVPAFARAVSRG
ncbi:NAD-dependent epimerase/dehydratase family protein [Aurantimonas sp. MSK8Z-1]|uniref:NAD-dependent epimerase/dehydratase family protein n=1 Tax=Mangrovibrevibacter kandeliae TaxID=2968473 RepID=UPI0021199484|nr:NAD-dependent epimerase/dehydratase family protein [Aurantimonas sp. MSK8Z-1]MCW4116762.1 NAD-dependent epimerase/dehydratase family protein [Aurantimonas sp. MSK8Z-1]